MFTIKTLPACIGNNIGGKDTKIMQYNKIIFAAGNKKNLPSRNCTGGQNKSV